MTEQDARIVINRKLAESGWILEGPNKNVLTEPKTIISEVMEIEDKINSGLRKLLEKI